MHDNAGNNVLHNLLIYSWSRGQTGSPDLQVKGRQVPELAVKVLFEAAKVGEASEGDCRGFCVCGGVKTQQPQRWVVHMLLNSPTSFPCPGSSIGVSLEQHS